MHRRKDAQGGRASFISFSFSFSLNFFPLAVGQPGPSTQEEELIQIIFAGTQPRTQNYPVP